GPAAEGADPGAPLAGPELQLEVVALVGAPGHGHRQLLVRGEDGQGEPRADQPAGVRRVAADQAAPDPGRRADPRRVGRWTVAAPARAGCEAVLGGGRSRAARAGRRHPFAGPGPE